MELDNATTQGYAGGQGRSTWVSQVSQNTKPSSLDVLQRRDQGVEGRISGSVRQREVLKGVCRGAQPLCRVCEGVPHRNIIFLTLWGRGGERPARARSAAPRRSVLHHEVERHRTHHQKHRVECRHQWQPSRQVRQLLLAHHNPRRLHRGNDYRHSRRQEQ